MEKSHEIDIIGLALQILKKWKQLLLFIFVAAIIGVVIALSKPKYYQAEVILAPELSSGGLSMSDNLADMASTFGIDLGGKNSVDAIYPELYPDIFGSTTFILGLFDVPVRLKDDNNTRTYKYHLLKEQKVPFWDYPKLWLINALKKRKAIGAGKGKSDPFIISKDDNDLCDGIRNSILCSVDKKTSVITISVTDQDPLVAAIMADTLQNRLQTYITDYRTKKARNDLQYYQKLTIKAKADYERVRRAYGASADANMDVLLESVRSKQEDVENDMQLKFNTYTSLNTQLQSAKAKLQERIPAFTIIQKPMMPYKAASTPRSIIVLLFMFLGVLCDAIWVLYGENIRKLTTSKK